MDPALRTLAACLARLREGDLDPRLLDALEARAQRVRGRTVRLPPRRALVFDSWTTPHRSALCDDLLAIAGGTPARSLRDADVALVVPADHDPADAALEERLSHVVPAPLEAWLLDGSVLLHHFGPRLVDTVEVFGCCLHPSAFQDLAERRAALFRRLR